MNQEINITKVSDLQIASFLIRANNELQRAVQNVQMMQGEVARREQVEEKKLSYENKDKAVGEETTQKEPETMQPEPKATEKLTELGK